jgi:D-aminopeptidase
MIKQHPEIGIRDDTPLPVVAECDDAALNDIQGRHVSADDVVKLLDAAKPADFARGSVGAGTGMLAFGFKAGIGSASRVLPAALGGYTVGVLVNDNTGSAPRANLTIDGVHVGRAFSDKLLPVFPSRRSALPASGHATDGSIIIIIATDAPLDATKLRELAKRATLGLARSGSNSKVSSGDLFLAFSTTHVSDGDGVIAGPALVADSRRIDQLYAAAADATEEAIDDALFSARTMTGRDGITFYGLPYEQVEPLLRR